MNKIPVSLSLDQDCESEAGSDIDSPGNSSNLFLSRYHSNVYDSLSPRYYHTSGQLTFQGGNKFSQEFFRMDEEEANYGDLDQPKAKKHTDLGVAPIFSASMLSSTLMHMVFAFWRSISWENTCKAFQFIGSIFSYFGRFIGFVLFAAPPLNNPRAGGIKDGKQGSLAGFNQRFPLAKKRNSKVSESTSKLYFRVGLESDSSAGTESAVLLRR